MTVLPADVFGQSQIQLEYHGASTPIIIRATTSLINQKPNLPTDQRFIRDNNLKKIIFKKFVYFCHKIDQNLASIWPYLQS